jgi:type I pantothenate kinase
MNPRPSVAFSPYTTYSREEWAALRADTPMPLSEAELENLSGLTERVSTQEVVDIYLPLSRLLNFYVEALQELHDATTGFLRKRDGKVPFIIGLAGSVAVGKSTTGRVLQALLARWPSHPSVELVPTDGFLYPNARRARADGPQRLPRKLRPAAAAQLPGRGEIGSRAHRGTRLFASRL